MAVKNIAVAKNIQVNKLAKLRGWFLALGILFVLFGFARMVLPAIGTITMDLLFGMVLFVLGISEIDFAFVRHRLDVRRAVVHNSLPSWKVSGA